MKQQNRIFTFALIGVYILTFWFISKNLNYEYLWFDEAGQFWISKGLNHDSAPFSPEGGLNDVIRSNQHYNKDPGGFSILLHYWSMVSNHHTWLRLLPFLFYTALIAAFVYVCFKWLKNIHTAMVLGLLPVFFTGMLNMGFEVRAYSMEMLGTLLCIAALLNLEQGLSKRKLLFWSLVMAIFMSSRYSAIIVVFTCSLYVLWLIWNDESTVKKRLGLLAAYTVPLLLALSYIYVFAFVPQNTGFGQLGYLQYLKGRPGLLFKPANLLYMLALGGFGLLYLYRHKFPAIKPFRSLLFLTLGVNALFILLSFLGMHPWHIGSKGCFSMTLPVLLCLALITGHLLNRLFSAKPYTVYIAIVLLCVVLIAGKNNTLLPKRGDSPYPKYDMISNAVFNFEKTDFKVFRKIYVECWESPYIRYLFEYGSLKNHIDKPYPLQFTLGKGIPHIHYTNQDSIKAWHERTPSMDALQNHDLIVASRLFDWSKTRNSGWKRMDGTDNFWMKREDALLPGN